MILRSPYPDVEVPPVALPEFLFGRLDLADTDRPAVLDAATGHGYTYGQLTDAIRRVAGALAERGLGPGAVAGLFAPNSPDYPVAFHGVLAAGAAVTPVNSQYTPTELAHQLRDAGATLLFTAPDGLARARLALDEPGVSVTEIVVLGDPGDSPQPGATPSATPAAGPVPETSFAELLTSAGPAPELRIDPESLAALPYSSGTTGVAKGVMLTHRNLVANLLQLDPIHKINAGSRLLAALPLYHIYGLTSIMNQGLLNRALIVTMPRFDLAGFLRAIAEYRIDHLYIVPPIALALAKSPLVDDYDVTSVRFMVSAAASLDAELGRALAHRLDAVVLQGFGLTESSPGTHGTPADRPDIDPGSIGLLIPSVEARVVDPVTGLDAAEGAPGELWCRGPNIMRGYLNNPEATAGAIDADGFLHTGDLVTADRNGIFRVVGRLKELIKYKGHQVAPAELEAVLLAHEAVADAAVVGVPDEHSGELPKAFIVRRDSHPGLAAEELLAFVAERVAPYKKIRLVEFLDRIPKSAAGKILRKELRAR
ncbi:MAG TPA: AMP-binding protein [Pseudonocardia sp.]|jgi:acyl-CoA synthetase (AMP-forming)/AMP-acid ligase II|nr:AMP-binding protein [Pseudonocardia sp.]